MKTKTEMHAKPALIHIVVLAINEVAVYTVNGVVDIDKAAENYYQNSWKTRLHLATRNLNTNQC